MEHHALLGGSQTEADGLAAFRHCLLLTWSSPVPFGYVAVGDEVASSLYALPRRADAYCRREGLHGHVLYVPSPSRRIALMLNNDPKFRSYEVHIGRETA